MQIYDLYFFSNRLMHYKLPCTWIYFRTWCSTVVAKFRPRDQGEPIGVELTNTLGLSKRREKWFCATPPKEFRTSLVSTVHPEKHLITLVNFVMKVYVPMWFEIKANPYVASGARHISKAISLVRQETEEIEKIVVPVLQRNAYLAHHENVLIGMLADENPITRELVWRKIKKSRSNKSSK